MNRCQKALLNAKDVRMKKTNEILTGIKYIKMWGTEEKFLESVSNFNGTKFDFFFRYCKIEKQSFIG